MDRIPPSDELRAHLIKTVAKIVPLHKPMLSNDVVSEGDKLSALRDQLVDRRRSIIMAAAKASIMLSHSAIRQIAELQVAISAIESVECEDI